MAVVNKGNKSNPLAMEMAECIIKSGRAQLLKTYPIPVYEGEASDSVYQSAFPMVFPEKLTVELLNSHCQISENAKTVE